MPNNNLRYGYGSVMALSNFANIFTFYVRTPSFLRHPSLLDTFLESSFLCTQFGDVSGD